MRETRAAKDDSYDECRNQREGGHSRAHVALASVATESRSKLGLSFSIKRHFGSGRSGVLLLSAPSPLGDALV